MSKKGISTLALFGTVIVGLISFLVYYRLHPKLAIATVTHMLTIGAHGFYGLGLFLQTSLSSHPPADYVDIGYVNNLKLKFLYFMRYHTNDNWLWEEWHDSIIKDAVALLESRNAKKDDEQIVTIPHFDYNEITPKKFYNDFVRMGRPAIIRNFPIKAMKWTPELINEKVGNYSSQMRCTGALLKHMTISEYMASRFEPNATVCYLEQGTDVLGENPHLSDDLEIEKFSEYAMNKKTPPGGKAPGFIFSQLFFGLFPSLGITYHCANYNNFFLMMHGRKKWWFVHPAHSFFMYPQFLDVMRSSASRISWKALHAENSSAIIDKYFQLFRYVPKYQFVMERGDILFNPAWNWHMVENLGEESIGVATRWILPTAFPYNNVLFSFLHFTAYPFWKFFYNRASVVLGITKKTAYSAVTHQRFDDQFNFGRVGSIYKRAEYHKELYPTEFWAEYMLYLKKKSEEDGVDYLNAH